MSVLNDFPPKELCEFIIKISQKIEEKNKEIPVVAVLCSISRDQPTGLFFKNNYYWKIESISANLVEKYQNVLYHAEFLAIEKFKKKSKNLYLNNKVLISNLEPCIYCFSLTVLHRIPKIYFFLKRDKSLSSNDILKLSLLRKKSQKKKYLNHHPKLIFLKEYSSLQKQILQSFFRKIRLKKYKII